MIAAILFCVSMIALGQWALYYWRANITTTAARQVSDRVRAAAGVQTPSVSSRDFRAILSVFDLTPDLKGPGRRYPAIRAYYLVVEKIGRLIPLLTTWAEAEMVMCSRYAAAVLEQRLERNSQCSTQMREK